MCIKSYQSTIKEVCVTALDPTKMYGLQKKYFLKKIPVLLPVFLPPFQLKRIRNKKIRLNGQRVKTDSLSKLVCATERAPIFPLVNKHLGCRCDAKINGNQKIPGSSLEAIAEAK
jgi:hypothetical protein